MHRLMVIYPAQSDGESFKRYYEEKHLPMSAQLPGLIAMRHNFAVTPLEGDLAPFCIFEAEFEDEAAMFAALQSPIGQAVAADVPNFAQVPPSLLHYSV